jgi:hypothetical protein
MRRNIPLAVSVCMALLSAAGAASATSLIYQSQSGQLRARGGTPGTGESTQQTPISGLDDVDEAVAVQDAAPPETYSASAALQTQLNPNGILLVGSTSASVAGCEPGSGFPCFADAIAEVDIRFDLEAPEILELDEGPHTGYNGPVVRLSHLDLGFLLSISWFDGTRFESVDCGSLSFEECEPLIGVVLGDGGGVPAGRYLLEFELFAFQPFGLSCAYGCNAAGGSAFLSLVPEPATAWLIALGIGGAVSAARRTRAG